MQWSTPEGDDATGPEGPTPALDRALEEQEDELIGQLLRGLQENIPGEATVSEAMQMMRRALLEDPETRELLSRLLTLGSHGGKRFFECLNGDRPWPDGIYLGGNPQNGQRE